jgi:hypothetical protein
MEQGTNLTAKKGTFDTVVVPFPRDVQQSREQIGGNILRSIYRSKCQSRECVISKLGRNHWALDFGPIRSNWLVTTQEEAAEN